MTKAVLAMLGFFALVVLMAWALGMTGGR